MGIKTSRVRVTDIHVPEVAHPKPLVRPHFLTSNIIVAPIAHVRAPLFSNKPLLVPAKMPDIVSSVTDMVREHGDLILSALARETDAADKQVHALAGLPLPSASTQNPAGRISNTMMLGSILGKLFGGRNSGPSDRQVASVAKGTIKRLSGKTLTDFNGLGAGEQMSRDGFIRGLLTAGVSEDEAIAICVGIFQKASSKGGAVFIGASQLLNGLKAKGTDPKEIVTTLSAYDANQIDTAPVRPPEPRRVEATVPAPLPSDDAAASSFETEIVVPLTENIFSKKDNALLNAFDRKLLSTMLAAYRSIRPRMPNAKLEQVGLDVVNLTFMRLGVGNPISFQIMFINIHMAAGRYLARLSDELWNRYEAQITKEFPEARTYRDGLKQGSDRRTIEQALAFPTEGEELIMHIGVGNDIDMVKDSLAHISPTGKVVIVDNDPSVMVPYHKDPQTASAIASGMLIVETTDAFSNVEGDAFRARYAGKATRVYIIHPDGEQFVTMRTVTAENGIVIHQTHESFPNIKAAHEVELFGNGDFNKLAGYGNGPAWFKTETATGMYKDTGIRFFVAKKKSSKP